MNNILKNYFSNRVLSRLSILIIDIAIIVFSSFFVNFIRYAYNGMQLGSFDNEISITLILVVFNTITFFIFKTYSGILRFTSFTDLYRILYALTLGYVASLVFMFVLKLNESLAFSLPTYVAIYIFNVLLMGFSRIFVKEVYDTFTGNVESVSNVFIYGTRAAGISVAKSLKGNNEFNFRLSGFISDQEKMIGKSIMGVEIYANNDKLFKVLESKNVKIVIVSPHKMEEIKNSPLLNKFVDHNISLLTTRASINEWSGILTSKGQLKDIQIEDLLPRDPININLQDIAKNIEGKRIMVTGAAGSIGSEIVRQVAAFNPYSIILIDQAETPLHNMRIEMQESWRNINTRIFVADIMNETRMRKLFQETKPQYVFHAAAYKHVPMMEENVSESIQTNIKGTKIMADLSVEFKVQKFVMISTDKAVNPSNIMGCSKRICEIYTQSLAKHLEKKGEASTQFITTRFGNVLGSNGSVIPLFKEQIKNGGPVTVTHPEIIRYFMTIPEACQLVLEAGSMGKGGEIYLFDMGKPVKILDLAKRMIRLSGSQNIKIEFTGLRQGEKLYEELLNKEEDIIPTHHKKIMVAKVQEYEFDVVSKKIDELIKTSYEYDTMLSVKQMKELVPEFKSINSPYQTIDEQLERNGN